MDENDVLHQGRGLAVFEKSAVGVIPNPRQRVRDLLFVRIRGLAQPWWALHYDE
jgi:hypothetical protein